MPQVLLPRVGILAFLDDEARARLATYGKVHATQPCEVVVREGEANSSLYIVISGSFDITMKAPARDVHLDSVGEGDCFGEVAVFQPGPVSATVTSVGAGQLWSITVEQFQQFLIDSPHAGCAVVIGIDTLLSRRLKRANAVIKQNEIVPAFLSVRSKKRPAA